jgi:hypothetical protein
MRWEIVFGLQQLSTPLCGRRPASPRKALLVEAPEERGLALMLLTQALKPVAELPVSAGSSTDLIEVLEQGHRCGVLGRFFGRNTVGDILPGAFASSCQGG